MIIFVFDRVENCGKGENAAGYQHFLLFPTMLSKAFFIRLAKKSGLCVIGLNEKRQFDWPLAMKQCGLAYLKHEYFLVAGLKIKIC